MKILVLSLLRLGDIIQQQALFAGLRAKYPKARIDVLVNRSALAAQEVVTGIDNWIVFEREELQQKVGIAEIPLLAPVHEMSVFFEQLCNEDYNIIYNFTHNRLSAYLAEGISADVKYGLVAHGHTFHPFNSAWLSHLNQRGLGGDTTPFQFVELMAAAYKFDISAAPAQTHGNLILLQPLTSDPKKNWSLTNWSQLLENLRSQFPAYQVRILGAPFEAGELSRHFSPDDLFLGNLAEVQKLLRRAALLITGDTSIKHLAAQNSTPILELALGSSNPARTGAYQDGAVILTAKIPCSPCAHSGRCKMMSHECGEALPQSTVLDAAGAILNGNALSAVKKPLVQYTTAQIGSEWVKGSNDTERIAAYLDRTLWRIYLDEKSLDGDLPDLKALNTFKVSDVCAALEIFAVEMSELKTYVETFTKQLQAVAHEAMSNGFDASTMTTYRHVLLTTKANSVNQLAQVLDFIELGQRAFAQPLAFFGAVQKGIADLSIRLRIGNLILKSATGGIQDGKLRDSSQRSLETP